MGPRSCERGNGMEKVHESLLSPGFNGAALVRARKSRLGEVVWERYMMLQWGRARASAEINRMIILRLRILRLQWGRARASAEIGCEGCAGAVRQGASMGPRSCERGNRWCAEGFPRSGFASMGPRSCERGNSLSPHSYPLKLIASMGPRSCERGNTSPVACAKKASNASMGPRSCERGNDTRLRASRQALDLLQWGRARASAEI